MFKLLTHFIYYCYIIFEPIKTNTMKSFYISILSLFLFASVAHAQDVSFGIFGGYNLSKVDNALGGDFADNKSNYHIGVIAELPQGEKWSFETAVFYSGEGEVFDDGNTERTIYLRFINVPVHFKYYISEKFSVHAGPQVGFLMNAKQSFREDGDREDIEGKVNSSFAFTGGLGYEFGNGLFLKGTFDLGVTDLFDNVEFSNDERTRVGHLSLGYRF